MTNTGDTALTNVQISDDQLGAITNVTDNGNGDSTPDAGESWTLTASATVTAGAYSNTGTVTADDTAGDQTSDTDDSHHFGADPKIEIKKLVSVDGGNSFEDADELTGPELLASGDDGDNILELGETWVYVVTGTWAQGQHTNTATATGDYSDHASNSEQPSDSDDAHYFNSTEAGDTDEAHFFGADLSAVGDFNGDGRDDLAQLLANGTLEVLLSTGSSFVREVWNQWSDSSFWHSLHAGAFNGDGKDDIAGFGHNGNWFQGLTTGAGFIGSLVATWSGSAFWHSVAVGDVNGDGLAELIGFTHLGVWHVKSANGLTTAWSTWQVEPIWNVVAGDVNGDGLVDVAGLSDGGTWFVGFSTGSIFQTSQVPPVWSGSAFWREVDLGDFNGDGFGDLLGISLGNRKFVGLLNGFSFVTTEWFVDGGELLGPPFTASL